MDAKSSNYQLLPDGKWPAGLKVLTYSFADYQLPHDGDRDDIFQGTISGAARDIIREAMDAWEAVCGVRFVEMQDGAHVYIRIGVTTWEVSDGAGGMWGWAWPNRLIPGTEYKAAIGFDPAEDWGDINIYDIALHEIGHVLGIAHSDVRGVVMSGGDTPYHDQPGRDVLQPDDIAAAQALFGPSVSDDTLKGSAGDDTIKGGFGNDSILGGDGDDYLLGNGVYWTHYGDAWSRTYDGSTDRDTIHGGNGNDYINGNAGADSLYGGPGNDTIFGGQNEGAWTAGKTRTNTIHLRDGTDFLHGGSGDDHLYGNMGTDRMGGGTGDDYMRGGQDNDQLFGHSGNDTLYGDLEADWLYGGNGNDVIVMGNNPSRGDGARDKVVFVTTDTGKDTIYGFEQHDLVYIVGSWSELKTATPSTPAMAEAMGLAEFHLVV